MTQRGDVSTDSPTVSEMFQAAPLPHQSGLRPASFPSGEAFVPCFEVLGFIGNGSVLSRAERHIGRSLRFRWWVGVFNRGILNEGRRVLLSEQRMQRQNVRPLKNCQLSIVHCQFSPPLLQPEIFQCLLQHFLVHRRIIDDQTFVAFRGGGLVEAAEQVDF